MTRRFSPLFNDGSSVLIALRSTYDTEDEAKQAGVEHATQDLLFIGVIRHLGPTGLRTRAAVLAQQRQPVGADGDSRWSGLVNRWRSGDTCGFITAADGVSWFLSNKDLPDGLTSLPVGTPVTFSGNPNDRTKNYPRAYSVRIAESA